MPDPLNTSAPIDAVITWVNGQDPKHKSKRLFYQKDARQSHATAVSHTRFDDQNEIYFCIASILKYAPFIRKIFVIADDQEPLHLGAFSKEGLCAPDRIHLVDHTHIFRGYEDVLPTFNSRTIETMLWRIEALAEQFVSFNDDFFLNQPSQPSAFFLDGQPILHGTWEKSELRSFKNRKRALLRKLGLKKKAKRANFRTIQNRAAQLAGVEKHYFLYDHIPRPARKSVFAAYFEQNPDILRAQIQHKFRDADQFTPLSLAYHLEINRFGVTPQAPASLAYFHPTENPGRDWLTSIGDASTAFACVQSLDECPADLARDIRQVMTNKFQDYMPQALR
ncbi:Stealth CR1 domain-containing protein [uncultured Tateyamaria sp.]|uniref:Stealth CR1 domain-containing protein n=1 Tax=uncultured Tateyamaria sp. TaxID=455651 RepID=UPI00261A81E9|nr:Stealth CR1 domain-containing protein [uncultured Tateyamaria sp.]